MLSLLEEKKMTSADRNQKWRAMPLAIALATVVAVPHAGFSQIAHRVKDINQTLSAAGSSFVDGVTIGNVTYFGADDGVNGFEFWRTGGTAAGTWLAPSCG
jgi:hypothetical protein